jgi:hypothetical protein
MLAGRARRQTHLPPPPVPPLASGSATAGPPRPAPSSSPHLSRLLHAGAGRPGPQRRPRPRPHRQPGRPGPRRRRLPPPPADPGPLAGPPGSRRPAEPARSPLILRLHRIRRAGSWSRCPPRRGLHRKCRLPDPLDPIPPRPRCPRPSGRPPRCPDGRRAPRWRARRPDVRPPRSPEPSRWRRRRPPGSRLQGRTPRQLESGQLAADDGVASLHQARRRRMPGLVVGGD